MNQHRLRIGLMIDCYKPYVSGVTVFVSLLKQALEKAGQDVYLFTFGNPWNQLTEANLVVSLGIKTIAGYVVGLEYTPKARHLLQTMDVIHTQHPFISGSLALKYRQNRLIPIVFTNHTRYEGYLEYTPRIIARLGKSYIHHYMHRFLNQVDWVVTPSADMQGILSRWGCSSQVEVVPNGVDVDRIHQAQPVPREKYDLKADDLVFIFVGRLSPEKNIDSLLMAFHLFSSKVPNARLMLVGDGSELPKLQHIVQELELKSQVVFTGMLSYAEIPTVLKLADVAVTASINEVHPLTIIEAFAAGLPVVCMQAPWVVGVVESGKNGIIASPTPESLAEAFEQISANAALRAALSNGSLATSKKFSIDKTSEKMLERYQILVQQKKLQESAGGE